MVGLKDFLFGRGEKYQQVPTYSKEQMALLNRLLGGIGSPPNIGQMPGYGAGLGYLEDLYSNDPQAFDKFSAPAQRQFNEQVVPGLAERFSELGGRNSSAFRNALLGAGETLTEQLQAQREGLRSQNLGSLLGYLQAPSNQYSQYLGIGLGARPYENVFRPGSPGFLGSLSPYLGGFLGQYGAQSPLMNAFGGQ